jgi:hypothetical protein
MLRLKLRCALCSTDSGRSVREYCEQNQHLIGHHKYNSKEKPDRNGSLELRFVFKGRNDDGGKKVRHFYGFNKKG